MSIMKSVCGFLIKTFYIKMIFTYPQSKCLFPTILTMKYLIMKLINSYHVLLHVSPKPNNGASSS